MNDNSTINKSHLINFRADLFGLVGLLVILSISLIPSIVVLVLASQFLHFKYFLLKIIAISFLFTLCYVIFGFSLLAVTVIVKYILNLKSIEGKLPLNSKKLRVFIKHHGLFHIACFFFLSLIRGTATFKKYLQLFGVKIGKNSVVQSIRLSDFDLIEIGQNSLIGFDAVICPHLAEGDHLIRKRILIGDNVLIGHYAILSPGVIIEDNVILGANSFVPKNQILKSGKVYGGVPAREIVKGSPANRLVNKEEAEEQRINSKLTNVEIDLLSKQYELNKNEILAMQTSINNVYISILGLLVTIFGFIVVNEKSKLITMIPILIEFAYAYIINSSISMIKLSKYLYKIELIFKKDGIRHFDWESEEGILGNSRGFDLDSVLINSIFLMMFIGSLFWTIKGNVFAETDVFLTIPILKILIIVNGVMISWLGFSGIYFVFKRKRTLKQLTNFQ